MAADVSRVHELLRDVLRSDVELSAFCQDHYPEVHARFTAPMDRAARTRLLLTEVADPAQLVARLHDFAPNAPAWGPQRRTWPYVLLAVTLLIALVGGFLAFRMTMGRRVAALLPGDAAWYGARHKESPCRITAHILVRPLFAPACSPPWSG